MPKIWVTRSQPGAARSVETLRALGYDVVAAPLLTIGDPESPPPELPSDAVLVITSQNALRALSSQTAKRSWSVVTVGDATAALAIQLGFKDTHSASGTWRDIAPLIEKHFPRDERRFIHIAGDIVRGRVCDVLSDLGYRAERRLYYTSTTVKGLPLLEITKINTVLLYSPKAAKALTGVTDNTAHLRAISISDETDAALGKLPLAERCIAAQPNEASMFTMLD